MRTDFSPALARQLREAHAVVAFSGAGISVESGVPTFRGTDGIWTKIKPEELASMNAFMKNPALVWEWYAHRRTIIESIEPNEGHRALVRMERVVPHFTIVTQNIDNLHRRAGSKVIHELHGNIERNYCMKCGRTYRSDFTVNKEKMPVCTECGGLVRPDIVWFGEMLPEEEWEASVRASEEADLFFSIGTSAVVYPAASLPWIAKRAGAYVVEINPEETSLTKDADEFLQGSSGPILAALADEMERCRREPSTDDRQRRG